MFSPYSGVLMIITTLYLARNRSKNWYCLFYWQVERESGGKKTKSGKTSQCYVILSQIRFKSLTYYKMFTILGTLLSLVVVLICFVCVVMVLLSIGLMILCTFPVSQWCESVFSWSPSVTLWGKPWRRFQKFKIHWICNRDVNIAQRRQDKKEARVSTLQ